MIFLNKLTCERYVISLIRREIVAIEVTTSTKLDDFTHSHGLDIGEQDAYITKVSIVCKKAEEWECEKLKGNRKIQDNLFECHECGVVIEIYPKTTPEETIDFEMILSPFEGMLPPGWRRGVWNILKRCKSLI